MNILVTGATGFVGSHMLDYLTRTTEDMIFGMRRLNSDMKHVKYNYDVNWVDGDLCDYRSVSSVIETVHPQQIYHFGALSWVTPSWNMPSIYMQTNAIGTINLFEALIDNLVCARVLVSCTPEEFGCVAPEDIPLTEESPLAPVNHYAASKMAQDAVCQSYYASYGTELEIIRTRAFNHEGPRRNSHGAIASFARQIAEIEKGLADPIVRVGNLDVTRNFTDVRDMVRAYYQAMAHGEPGELYLIGSDNIYTIKDCLDMLISFSTYSGTITIEQEAERKRPTELPLLIGDYTKFRTLTNWKPEYNFDRTLSDILDYWRTQV